MASGLAAWILLSLVGVVIVLVPDEGSRLFSLSEGHGPSPQDALGVIVLLIGWSAFLVPLYHSAALIGKRRLLATLIGVGLIVLVWSLLTDSGLWWILGAGVLVAVQIAATVMIIRRGSIERPRGTVS